MNKLIERSDQLGKKAGNLLGSFPLESLAKKHFGDATLTGSTSMNLMLEPDIDINVITNKLNKQTVFEFINEILEIKEARKVILYNRLYESIPLFIINLERFVFEDETWTITFHISQIDKDLAIPMSKWVKENMDNEKRQIILTLKQFRIDKVLTRKIPSVVIYEAVLKDHITDIESFLKYLSSKGTDIS